MPSPYVELIDRLYAEHTAVDDFGVARADHMIRSIEKTRDELKVSLYRLREWGADRADPGIAKIAVEIRNAISDCELILKAYDLREENLANGRFTGTHH